jgi:hypothetical protein
MKLLRITTEFALRMGFSWELGWCHWILWTVCVLCIQFSSRPLLRVHTLRTAADARRPQFGQMSRIQPGTSHLQHFLTVVIAGRTVQLTACLCGSSRWTQLFFCSVMSFTSFLLNDVIENQRLTDKRKKEKLFPRTTVKPFADSRSSHLYGKRCLITVVIEICCLIAAASSSVCVGLKVVRCWLL